MHQLDGFGQIGTGVHHAVVNATREDNGQQGATFTSGEHEGNHGNENRERCSPGGERGWERAIKGRRRGSETGADQRGEQKNGHVRGVKQHSPAVEGEQRTDGGAEEERRSERCVHRR